MLKKMITLISLGWVIYQWAIPFTVLVDPLRHLDIHLTLSLLVIFLVLLEGSEGFSFVLQCALILLTLAVGVYVFIFAYDMQFRSGFPTTPDMIAGLIVIGLVLEGTRRSFGAILTVVALLAIGYLFVGQWLPHPFGTPPTSFSRLMSVLATSMGEGIYGMLTGISANYLFLFIIFGALLRATPAIEFFSEIGRLIGSKFSSGAALSAVITSCLMGTVTGSVGANVATTGSFTIPLMKSIGYKPEQAGGIEGMASTGGQIMPPVMGAAGFILAEYAGIPYITVMGMAFLPALLYYICGALYVHFQGMAMHIKAVEEKADLRKMALSAPAFFIPLTLLMVLMEYGFSLGFSMGITMAALLLIAGIYDVVYRRSIASNMKSRFMDLAAAAPTAASIALSCAAIGLLIASLYEGGLVIKLPSMISRLCEGSIPLALLLGSIISIILGMGMATSAVYVLVAVIVVPVLIKLGVYPPSAHFFALYYAVMGSLTPPVAIAALVASRISGASYWNTSVECAKAGIAGWIIPWFFIYFPILLLQPEGSSWDIVGLFLPVVTLIFLQTGLSGFFLTVLSVRERVVLIVGAGVLFLCAINRGTVMIGLSILITVLLPLWHIMKKIRQKGAIKPMTAGNTGAEREL